MSLDRMASSAEVLDRSDRTLSMHSYRKRPDQSAVSVQMMRSILGIEFGKRMLCKAQFRCCRAARWFA